MNITGINLRLVCALVAGLAAFAAAAPAPAAPAAKSQDKKAASEAKGFNKMDPATKEKWEKLKSRLEAERIENQRKSDAALDAKLSAMRMQTAQGKRSAKAGKTGAVPQSKDGTIYQGSPVPPGITPERWEQHRKLVQQDIADSRAENAKASDQFKKHRKESDSRRLKTGSEKKDPKKPDQTGAPGESKKSKAK